MTHYCLALLAIFAFAVVPTHAVVQKFNGRLVEVVDSFRSPLVDQRLSDVLGGGSEFDEIVEEGLKRLPGVKSPYARSDAESGSVDIRKLLYIALAANITVGTPEQKQTVLLDFWTSSYIYLLGVPAKSTTKVKTNSSVPAAYNTSASTTYQSTNKTFSIFGGKAYVGSDNLVIGQATLTNVTLNVVDSRLFSFLRKHTTSKASGIIGLVPYNQTSFVEEVQPQLDDPVVTLTSSWTSLGGEGSARITLGSEDHDDCNADFAYAPVEIDRLSKTINASAVSASFANGTVLLNADPSLNASITVSPILHSTVVSPDLFDLIVNATEAVWNTTHLSYRVECEQLTNGGLLVFSVGSSRVELTAADVIGEFRHGCFLNLVYGLNRSTNYVIVGTPFLANHCLAYNIKTQELGISSAKRSEDY